MFKSPQVRRWASATWCPSPWTTGCGECHRWSVAWSIDSYDPPYIEHWDLAIKHWDGCLMHQMLGVHHHRTELLLIDDEQFIGDIMGYSDYSGIQNKQYTWNECVIFRWTNRRNGQDLSSGVEEVGFPENRDPVVVLETRFSRRFRGRFLLSTMDRVDARRSRRVIRDRMMIHTDIQTYIHTVYVYLLNSQYHWYVWIFSPGFQFLFFPKGASIFPMLSFCFSFPQAVQIPTASPEFFSGVRFVPFFQFFFFFSDSDSFLYSYIFFPMFCPFSFKKTTSSKPAELRPRTAKMLQMKDNDEGNSQDDFTENDLHMLPMWNISLQDAESMRSWDDTKHGESVRNISTICILGNLGIYPLFWKSIAYISCFGC